VDVDIAATDVREKKTCAARIFRRMWKIRNPEIRPERTAILTMALTGDATVEELYDYADNTLRDRHQYDPRRGGRLADRGEKREVHVLLDREKLAARPDQHGCGERDQTERAHHPSGRVKEGDTEYSVKFEPTSDVQRIGELEIANRDGSAATCATWAPLK
jgi:HAE1 family hydrophobic/amphiphilic exporter-1